MYIIHSVTNDEKIHESVYNVCKKKMVFPKAAN